MQLFQKSVLNKYLNQLDSSKTQIAYEKFREFFHNLQIQENIRLDKEEQFQEGFLRELFVDVLGYTINPHPGYNLTTEYKNESGSQKADGAILINGEAIGVIELKSTKTKDLESIRKQAFDYKANHKNCIYVMTSNFEKLRFYINNAVDFEEFDLFNLTKDRFQLLYLCLHKDKLISHLPEKIKEESLVQEEVVTKKLYSDYSEFKRALFNDIAANKLNGSEHEEEQLIEQKKLLFKKTQKLIDRLLFILFCEDRGLLPPNEISNIIKEWQELKDKYDEYKPLYDRFKKHFGYIYTGYKHEGYEIYPYNGGLFEEDELLTDLKITDEILKSHTKKLTSYDFESEVDVDILGHIFEQSITEIETITAEIEGVKFDKSKSRRKKEGVYYTPKYITKYIVDNTVGKLCEEKRNELGILEEEYFKGKKNRKRDTILELEQKLNDYQKYLLTLKICDPACGSGAFLNQALEFLIAEHRYIEELRSKLFESKLVLPNIENEILEKNLYGVDINEEAVEIAKLSLWLRTAKKGRRLSSLNENIKCGNSLIDDPEVAGDKAFKWEQEFPEVFANGGFDVVIGNPPYGAEISDQDKIYFSNKYETYEYQINTYVVFYERGMECLTNNGFLGFITPATFTYQHFYKKLRDFLQRYKHISISKYFYEVFDDADIGDSVSWIMQKNKNDESSVLVQICRNKNDSIGLHNLVDYKVLVNNDKKYLIVDSTLDFSKCYIGTKYLKDIANIIVGIKPYQTGKGKPEQTSDIVKKKIFTSNSQLDQTYLQCVVGKDFHRYRFNNEPLMYLSYGKWLAEPRETAPFFDYEKIILRQTSDSLIGHLDDNKRINLNNVYNIGKKNFNFNLKYLLAILNSKLMNLIYQSISQEKGRTFAEVKKVNLAKLPIKIVDNKYQELFIDKVNLIIKQFAELNIIKNRFIALLSNKFSIDKQSKRLQDWYEDEFIEFIKELKKSKIKLSLSEEAEWMEYFNQQKAKALELKEAIDKTDKEIDQMVYELYGLTDEEIKIVEESVKN